MYREINFYYKNVSCVKIPEENFIGLFEPASIRSNRDEGEVIEEALRNPIESPTLSEMAKKQEKSPYNYRRSDAVDTYG